ncbi:MULTISPECIES: AraC family transcriptional regulator [unclassified Amycolatopsis]|uniref:AraC family transcriptional regulator n=1 Tax=Amycolatopsis TaxID=1813 RepID=UPI00138AE6F9|nr:AraC family transcriptional regulator [Amycolatopsis sp. ATCC 39116]
MSRVLCPHRLDVIDPRWPLDARMNSTRLHHLVVNYVEYSAPVLVEPGETGSFSVVQAHLRGQGTVSSGQDQVLATRDRIVVSSSREPLRMSLTADSCLVLLRIDSSAVETVLTGFLGEDLRQPVRFELGMHVAYGAPRSWYRSLLDCVARVDKRDAVLVSPVRIDRFEQAMIFQLLAVQHNNYSSVIDEPVKPASARLVRSAVELIETGSGVPPTEIAVARDLGVGLRHLRAAFKHHRGATLADHLLGVRLQRARRDLLTADPRDVTLNEVTQRWGFDVHSFVPWYQAAFGETPDLTLRQ